MRARSVLLLLFFKIKTKAAEICSNENNFVDKEIAQGFCSKLKNREKKHSRRKR